MPAIIPVRLHPGRARVRKITVFLELYTVVITGPAFLALFGSEWLKRLFPGSWWFGPLTLFGVMATAAPILYLAFVRRLEGQLLKDQRRYHRTLITASSGMTRVKDIHRLCRLIVHMVNRTVRLTNSGLFLYESKEQRYILQHVRYSSLIPDGVCVESTDPLVELLQEDKDLVMIDELREEMEAKHDEERARKSAWVYSWMRKFEARLIVPSFSNDRLIAFLMLGAKRSGEPYTTDDIAVFSGLANQAALAIENALFFEELRDNEAYIIQSEKLASLGQLASGMAHEIHNPLTIISGEAQLYLERFKGQDHKVDEVLQSIIEECQRAADITQRILRFAKPAPADLAPLDLRSTVEETLTLAGYQVRLEKIERVVSLPTDPPKVRGNQNQLQEVILNLIINACQAMGDTGGRLEVRGSIVQGSVVQLEVIDNGPGIPAAKLSKVFDPFYTTKPTGTGLGLFVSQRIMKAHGGTLEVDSTEGNGACFTIRLPVWQQPQAQAEGVTVNQAALHEQPGHDAAAPIASPSAGLAPSVSASGARHLV